MILLGKIKVTYSESMSCKLKDANNEFVQQFSPDYD